ncbi:restriction endonuclease [Micromonospora craterilacus]|uniref:Restriction endonuclease n=1 Tax=Micromonospora craterilacus TaxID=1655439 RepID=A0A2W2FAF2_9ACTN|nr:restriction endonuclease subunit S [Micromonospora craterilacus]PZG12554.1 restriction endonuclease [Micromonospora craterilacus]
MSESVIGRVPSGWALATLGDLCRSGGGEIQTGPFGSQLHASDYVVTGIPSVMPQNIGDNVIVEDRIARISPEDAERLSRYLLRDGDIVYSRRGDVERRALVSAAQDGWLCGTGCLRVRLGDSADPRYISYYLGHPKVRQWIVRHAVGATMPNLNTSILSDVPVVSPPRAIQEGIASTLGVLDDKIAVNKRIDVSVCELAEVEYARVVSMIGERATLGDLVDLKYGKSLPAGQRRSGDIPVYGSGGVGGWHDESLVAGPGIVVGRKGTVGAIHWEQGNFFPIDTTFFVQVRRPDVPLEFVFFAMKNLGLASMNSDSAVPGLNRTNALAATVPLPPIEEVGRFARRVKELFELRHSLLSQSQRLADLRDALLPGLMSGAIQARDAEKAVEDAT